MPDIVKYVLAAAITVAGVAAFYYLPDMTGGELPTFVLIAVLLAALAAALGLLATTEKGSEILEFARGSRTEVRKMIWPTRKETVQGTTIVIIMVILVGLLLWAFDWVIFKVIYEMILASA